MYVYCISESNTVCRNRIFNRVLSLVLQYSLQASIAELASTAATDVGMHGLLASQSCYHSVLPPSLCTLWTSSRFLHY